MRISQAKEQAVELPFILRDYKGRPHLLPRLAKQDRECPRAGSQPC